MKYLVVCCAILVFLQNAEKTRSARILCVFQMPSVSHQHVFQPIWTELAARGHEVVVVTPNPIKNSSLTNFYEIDISEYGYNLSRSLDIRQITKDRYVASRIMTVMEINYKLADHIFSNPEFKKIYLNPNEKFDLVIAQTYVSPIFYALSNHFNAPLVLVNSMQVWLGTHVAMGNPHPPALFSEKYSDYNGLMTFYERLCSTLYYAWAVLYKELVVLPKSDAIARKYLGEDLPYLGDIEKNASAMLVSTNPFVYPPRAYSPNVLLLDSVHVKPPKPLPKDLQEIMDGAKNGIIYFSFGSNVQSSGLNTDLASTFMAAVSELPYTVLWKWEKDDFPGKPKNVVSRKWFPQQDVLAHKNVKLFITQCGLQSIEETISREVPFVCIPFISDQTMNAKKLVEYEATVQLDYLTITKEDVKNAILEVLGNEKYKNNVKKIKDLLQDQPMTGLERAIWWIEYVIRHKGARHLRSPMADISYFEYLLIDVIAVILLGILSVIFVVHKLMSLLFRKGDSKKKVKKN